jgi:Fur family ferric uptake transcriptional regulator
MSHNERNFADKIRQQGYRFTPQRQLVLDALCAIGGHATIEEIYESVQKTSPAVNLATVYRTLHLLEELRLVVSAEIQGKSVYEIAQPDPHHHLVCRACGAVLKLHDRHLHEFVQHLAQEHHFYAEIDHLTISGLCANCQQSQVET